MTGERRRLEHFLKASRGPYPDDALPDERQAQDTENVAFARREDCRDVIARYERLVAAAKAWREKQRPWGKGGPFDGMFKTDDEDALIAAVDALEALAAAGVPIVDLEAERDEAEERSRAWEHAAQTQADALAEAEARCARYEAMLRDWVAAYRAAAGDVPDAELAVFGAACDELVASARAALGDAGGGTGEGGASP